MGTVRMLAGSSGAIRTAPDGQVTSGLRLLRFYYGTSGRRHCPDRRHSPRSSSGSTGSRRNVPERPPVFSHRAMSPMVIVRSADLHMS